MEDSKHVILFITTPNPAEAQKIARLLLEQRQAACVNIIPTVDSLFRWQDKLDSARESLMVVKTRADKVPEIVELVKANHTYTVPEIIAFPIVGGNPEYLEWIDREVK
ncbi:MAG: divalent-cation tolerance protein CutA [Dehalococcoidales bacterium]|nr:divalent-cation tolerance protein CutA [Dehalococcoidales bacterium]